MATAGPQLLDKHEASQFLKVKQRRLSDAAWRRRFGLPAIHVGGALRFDPVELRQWLESRREKAPGGRRLSREAGAA